MCVCVCVCCVCVRERGRDGVCICVFTLFTFIILCTQIIFLNVNCCGHYNEIHLCTYVHVCIYGVLYVHIFLHIIPAWPEYYYIYTLFLALPTLYLTRKVSCLCYDYYDVPAK